MIKEDPRSVEIPVLRIRQPIGEIYVGSISAKKLYEIAHFDVRRIEKEDGFDQYLGIQRELNKQRVKAIREYVKGADASFPTSVVLAIDERCVRLEQPCEGAPEFFRMTLSNYGEDEAGNAIQVNGEPIQWGDHHIWLRGVRYAKPEVDCNPSAPLH